MFLIRRACGLKWRCVEWRVSVRSEKGGAGGILIDKNKREGGSRKCICGMVCGGAVRCVAVLQLEVAVMAVWKEQKVGRWWWKEEGTELIRWAGPNSTFGAGAGAGMRNMYV